MSSLTCRDVVLPEPPEFVAELLDFSEAPLSSEITGASRPPHLPLTCTEPLRRAWCEDVRISEEKEPQLRQARGPSPWPTPPSPAKCRRRLTVPSAPGACCWTPRKGQLCPPRWEARPQPGFPRLPWVMYEPREDYSRFQNQSPVDKGPLGEPVGQADGPSRGERHGVGGGAGSRGTGRRWEQGGVTGAGAARGCSGDRPAPASVWGQDTRFSGVTVTDAPHSKHAGRPAGRLGPPGRWVRSLCPRADEFRRPPA